MLPVLASKTICEKISCVRYLTHGIFFNQSEYVADYLSIKCPHFNYKKLPREDVIKSRIIQNSTKIIIDCEPTFDGFYPKRS